MIFVSIKKKLGLKTIIHIPKFNFNQKESWKSTWIGPTPQQGQEEDRVIELATSF